MKTQLKTFALFVFLAAVSFSCKKDDNESGPLDLVVRGYLLDVSTNEPIANGTVFLNQTERGTHCIGCPVNYGKPFMETLTDDKGYYRFEFTADQEMHYILFGETEGYYPHRYSDFGEPFNFDGRFPTSGPISIKYYQPKKTLFFETIRVIPEATLRVRIKNVNKVYDRFFLNPPPGSPVGPGLQLSGMELDYTHDFRVFGNLEITLNGGVFEPGGNYENGRYKYVKYEVTAKAHDVTEYLIEY